MEIPYYCKTVLVELARTMNTREVIERAYQDFYDPSKPPVKHKCEGTAPDGQPITILQMPYLGPDGLFIEKTLMINPKKRPGITGYVTAYDTTTETPLATFDATSLTGLRTAAKSALFAEKAYANENPRSILIVGSSTEALYHAFEFRKVFPETPLYVKARSEESKQRILSWMKEVSTEATVIFDTKEMKEPLDLVIGTTPGTEFIITPEEALRTRVMIAVGSSSGTTAEFPRDIVLKSYRVIDSRISIPGKGEANLAISEGKLKDTDFEEFKTYLNQPSTTAALKDRPLLFISKGLAIEDYAFVKAALAKFKDRPR